MDKILEEKWMIRWEKEKVFESNPDPSREKKLVTFPYPYMNGPLHIGHAFTSVRVDAYARVKRMQGFNVLFPWAWHWTGQPIVAAAERLSRGDQAMIREFVEIDKVPRDELSKFYDPKYMAQYYTDSGRIALKRIGLSIDWRREFHTTDLEPTFNKFVLWQYSKLREKGYVTRGTHPVVWCPRDQSPTGDHDRVAGEGVTWEEFTLVLFSLSNDAAQTILPAATFRPETIFGVTNLWINPESRYVEIEVDGKARWIVSLRASEKLKDQLKKISVIRELVGAELIGKKVRSPMDSGQLLTILPASFVDPNNGTGVVYSVPAHAPMDYVALRDIQNNSSQLSKYGLSTEDIANIKPIPLITIPAMGEYPAIEIIERMGIKNQNDPRVEEATAEIYRKEFHQGILNKNTGIFQSKRVSEVKPLIIDDLKKRGLACSFYDLPEKVVCRCMTECTVKILEDQWFLKYSDPEWKRLAHECVDRAGIYPETARQWFHDVIDWMKDWPCARRIGLGTPLPWSPGWIVETLSDSTIYMAFYTIRATIKKLGISAGSLTDSLFDYVFLGKGNAETLTKETKLTPEVINSMRSEFLYWYPVNLRNSAKELIPNHLTFFIFQHVAFFQKELWPTSISANGMMMIEGVKMSKSKGNVITMWGALDQYGADALRAALIGGSEGLDDLDWREKNARDIQMKINSLPAFIKSLEESAVDSGRNNATLIEFWLENQIQKHISNVRSYMDAMKTKSAFQETFFNYWNDLRRYMSRTDSRPKWLLEYAIDVWIRLLSPFIPYACEEINEQRGSNQIMSVARFPEEDESRVHTEAYLGETLIERLLADAQNILKLVKTRPKSIYIYTADHWKYALFRGAIQARESGEKTSDTLQRFFLEQPDVPKKDVANTQPKIMKIINELGEEFLHNFEKSGAKVEEFNIYKDAASYLEKELGLRMRIYQLNETGIYDPSGKAKFALPFKPALYLE